LEERPVTPGQPHHHSLHLPPFLSSLCFCVCEGQ
jgi:hypothetical protein